MVVASQTHRLAANRDARRSRPNQCRDCAHRRTLGNVDRVTEIRIVPDSKQTFPP
jgi:hypothetical protein